MKEKRMTKIIQISDLHIRARGAYRGIDSTAMLRELMSSILRLCPSILIITGDICDPPSPENYEHAQRFIKQIASKEIKVFITLGNHDDPDLCKKYMNKFAIFAPFNIRLQKRLIIGLDSVMNYKDKGCFPESQIEYASNLNISQDLISIFSHHHIKNIGVEKLDQSRIKNSEELLHNLNHKVDSYFFGHIHQPYTEKIRSEHPCNNVIHALMLHGCPSTAKNFPIIQENWRSRGKEGFRVIEYDTIGRYKTYCLNAQD